MALKAHVQVAQRKVAELQVQTDAVVEGEPHAVVQLYFVRSTSATATKTLEIFPPAPHKAQPRPHSHALQAGGV